jgi:hypothetical protein
VAPVTGGIANGKEDGLVLAASFFKRLVSPRIPVHRIVGVLEEVRALFVDETVGRSSVFVHGPSEGSWFRTRIWDPKLQLGSKG